MKVFTLGPDGLKEMTGGLGGGCGDPECTNCGGDGSLLGNEAGDGMTATERMKKGLSALESHIKKETDPVSKIFYQAMYRVIDDFPNVNKADEIPGEKRLGLLLVMLFLYKWLAREGSLNPVVGILMMSCIASVGAGLDLSPPEKSSVDLLDTYRVSIN